MEDGIGLDGIRIAPLSAGELAAVAELTFPSFRQCLRQAVSGEVTNSGEMLALAAWRGESAVGLVLASVSVGEADIQARALATVLSVAVSRAWRRQGIGSALLGAMEERLRSRAVAAMDVRYTSRIPALAAFEALLARNGWHEPWSTMSMAVCDSGVIRAPWISPARPMPDGFELFGWDTLRDDEREALRQGVERGEIPSTLSPFADEADTDPQISVGVRHCGKVVGWMIVTRSPLVPNAMCYRSQFVMPGLRASHALGPMAVAEAIRRHFSSPIMKDRPFGVFGMPLKSSVKMINFFHKRLTPYCVSSYDSRRSIKMLDGSA